MIGESGHVPPASPWSIMLTYRHEHLWWSGTDDAPATSVATSTTSTTRQDADFLTAQGRASLFDEALKGSILSPATWRQASSAVRQRK